MIDWYSSKFLYAWEHRGVAKGEEDMGVRIPPPQFFFFYHFQQNSNKMTVGWVSAALWHLQNPVLRQFLAMPLWENLEKRDESSWLSGSMLDSKLPHPGFDSSLWLSH